MAGAIKDSFLDLERHRQLLEENVEKLGKALRHWQTWEAEYEGLKEEILAADPPPNRQQLIKLARGYEGDLVTRKEVEDIIGSESRGTAQVVNILDKRIDYVEQNIRTIKKQIEVAEEKLAAATIISTPEVRNDEGLPLTEIIEELDEEGNIISSHTSTPGSAKPQLLEVLRKAGVSGLPSSDPSSSSNGGSSTEGGKEADAQKNVEAQEARPAKKGVKFAEDTKAGPPPERSRTAKRVEEIMSIAKRSEERPSEPPLIPTDESVEDAEIRREMLQYGISEVGAVVAELNFEDGSDWSGEDYEDGVSTTDDEDEFGRTTGRIVDDELRQRMIELEERLGARFMENIGNKASDPIAVREGIGRVTINTQDDSSTNNSDRISDSHDDSSFATSANLQKTVRFSEDLDISPDPPQAPTTTPANVAPVGDIVERTVPATSFAPVESPAAQKKTSRFKSNRTGNPKILNRPLASQISGSTLPLQPLRPSKPNPFSQPIEFPHPEEYTRVAPTGPEGKTLATTIVEREVPLDGSATEPDELDPHLLHQEVAAEYHRMRNRMVQRQGGFMKEEESEVVPFSEEEGGPKKMSRFKAARLAKS